MNVSISLYIIILLAISTSSINLPLVINTWNFQNATKKALNVLKYGGTAKDAVTFGCEICEIEQCDFTVGFGGSPDENGETTLDAMIFDGTDMNMGAVGGLRRIKNAMQVARDVLEHTDHSILVGDLATDFAKTLGYKEESLSTPHSKTMHTEWRLAMCQPNFWKDVKPDPTQNCGPYHLYQNLTDNDIINYQRTLFNNENHDTIGMVVADVKGNIIAGTSSNGAKFKIPGRVGDAPLPGAGAYADSEVGGAAATGDGDVMMRFLPSFLAVEEMRRGSSPQKAARLAISRIANKFPKFFGGVIALNNKGDYGAACNGMDYFPFSVAEPNGIVSVKSVKCN